MADTPAFDYRGSGVDIQVLQQQIEAPQFKLSQDKIWVAKLTKAVAIPSVKNVTKFKASNTSSQNITDFANGQEGQEIQILGDGHTTAVNAASPSIGNTIVTLSGSNLSMSAGKIYSFLALLDPTGKFLIWYQK